MSYILDSLIQNDITDIIIVVGYKKEQIITFCNTYYNDIKFTFVENNDYENNNNMYSFYLATKHITNTDFLLMNSDLIFESSIITGLIQSKVTSIAVDKNNYLEEAMKLIVIDNKIKRISKSIPEQDCYGSSIDIYFINKSDMHIINNKLLDFIEGKKDHKQWTEVLLDSLFIDNILIAEPYDIQSKKWFEIDNEEDLLSAELLFNDNVSKLLQKTLYLIDKDGTLSIGEHLIDKAKEFLDTLDDKNISYKIVTNNSSKINLEHQQSFKKMNINIDINNIYSSLDSLFYYLKNNKINNIFILGTEVVVNYFKENGFNVSSDNCNAIILTYDTTIDYEKIKQFNFLLSKNILYLATHNDIVCPTENGNIPDIGSFIALFEKSSSRLPDVYFGKPNRIIVDSLIHNTQHSIHNTVLIGDRLYTDIELAQKLGMLSVLVLSGETKRSDYEFSNVKADIVVKSIETIMNIIKKA